METERMVRTLEMKQVRLLGMLRDSKKRVQKAHDEILNAREQMDISLEEFDFAAYHYWARFELQSLERLRLHTTAFNSHEDNMNEVTCEILWQIS